MKTKINNTCIKILRMVPKGKKQECGHLLDQLLEECEEAFSVRTLKNPFDHPDHDHVIYHRHEEEE